ELSIMRNSEHPNLVRLYTSFVHKNELWIVMELMDYGSMLDIIRYKSVRTKGGVLSENVIATVIKEVLQGLDHLHRNMKIHRDVKAGNILLNANGEVKLADFGVSAFLGDTMEASKNLAADTPAKMTFVGTPCWMAPEVLEQTTGYNTKADIWSLGITVIELATGVAPYASKDPLEVMHKILREEPPTLQTVGEETARAYNDYKQLPKFIKKCLEKDTAKRPSAVDLLKSSLVSKFARDAEYLRINLINELP
ncbi:uncharacterized protein MONBRDRAFT_1727, partial [Monosiga brevicollis MX1]